MHCSQSLLNPGSAQSRCRVLLCHRGCNAASLPLNALATGHSCHCQLWQTRVSQEQWFPDICQTATTTGSTQMQGVIAQRILNLARLQQQAGVSVPRIPWMATTSGTTHPRHGVHVARLVRRQTWVDSSSRRACGSRATASGRVKRRAPASKAATPPSRSAPKRA